MSTRSTLAAFALAVASLAVTANANATAIVSASAVHSGNASVVTDEARSLPGVMHHYP